MKLVITRLFSKAKWCHGSVSSRTPAAH